MLSNTLSQSIDSGNENPRYDEACKRVLAEKIILAWILKYCVKEYEDIAVKEIAEKYIEGTPEIASVSVMPDLTNSPRITGVGVEDSSNTEGSIFFDIRFSAIIPGGNISDYFIINVEAQDDFYPGYPLIKRAIYYCSRLISSQYGTVFTKSHYEKIQKVHSIWICMNPPKEREYSITEYSFGEKSIVGESKEKKENYDIISAVMICLGKPKEGRDNPLLNMLEVLLSVDDKDVKKNKLSNDFDIPMTEQLEQEVDEMCNLSMGVERKGVQKGLQQGLITAIKNLVENEKWPVERAMEALSIPQEERKTYADILKKEEMAN